MDELTFKTFMENNKDSKEHTCLRFKRFRSMVQPNIYELAEESQSTTSMINRIEKGEIFPDIPTLNILCKLYGLSINWLFSGEGSMFRGKGPKTPDHVYKIQAAIETLSKNQKEVLELMQIPRVEEIIFRKLEKIKMIAKDESNEWENEKRRR